jgi:hypothetical protein
MIWMNIWYLLFNGIWTIIFWIYNRSNIIQRDNNHCWVIGWEIPSTQHVDVSEMMSHPTTELQTSVFVAKDANLIQWYSGMNGQGQQIFCLLTSKLDLVVCSYWKARRTQYSDLRGVKWATAEFLQNPTTNHKHSRIPGTPDRWQKQDGTNGSVVHKNGGNREPPKIWWLNGSSSFYPPKRIIRGPREAYIWIIQHFQSQPSGLVVLVSLRMYFGLV